MDDIVEFNDLIIKRFEELCVEREINQFKLHKISGIAKSTLSEFFSGSYKTTSMTTIKRLCDAIGISVEKFFNHPYFRQKQENLDK